MASEEFITLNLDASGSMVSAPEDVINRIYLYVGCVALGILDEDRKLIFPLLEMISSAHDAFTICKWLEEFIRAFEKKYKKPPRISKVVTDFSFAILNAISKAFNKQSLIEYINSTYSDNGEVIKKGCKCTTIHICCNHFMKTTTQDINLKFPKNSSSNVVRVFIKETMALMFNLSTIESLEETFRNLSIILNSKYVTERVTYAVKKITLMASESDSDGHRTDSSVLAEHDVVEVEENPEILSYDEDEDDSMYTQSIFYKRFLPIAFEGDFHDASNEQLSLS